MATNPAGNLLSQNSKIFLWVLGLLIVFFLVFYNLTRFPAPWFDEGSHLHVPKTLVKYGVYADISSEGFRYYGPTIGVGPTVMLPIAAIFEVFGIGLLQARLVMTFYLLAAAYVFYRLAVHLSTKTWVAAIALTLLLSSRSVLFLEYGRQVLGEVPGFFFLMLALYLWFMHWNENDWKWLSLTGLLFGLAMITKYQYLLFIAPTLIFSWGLDIFYYKTSTHRNFLIPGVIAAGSFGIWQIVTLQYLGPATMKENLALLRVTAEGAAFNFNLSQLVANADLLSSRSVYLEALLPAMIYGFFISIPRTHEGQKFSVVYLLVALNLVWFVFASIGWIRYAFLGLSLSGIFIARFFYDLTSGFQFDWNEGVFHSLFNVKNALRFAVTAWLAAMVLIPLAKTVSDIALPGPAYAKQMSDFLNANVPVNVVIETWDPEMGFLTDHNYHYPPNALLAIAVNQLYHGGELVQNHYDYLQQEKPEYLLLGEFSKWTDIYPINYVQENYQWIQTFGEYDLYLRVR